MATDRMANAVPGSGGPFRVLVVDPDADTRALYQLALPPTGCEVIEAGDGRDALTKALAAPPTLIITELRLPLMDGFALCEILRRDAATRSVPILVVTAEARPAELDRIRNAGATAVFVKPTLPDAIVSEVRNLTNGANGHRGRRASARMNAVVQPTQSADAPHSVERASVSANRHQRFQTTAPPTPPPALTCPACERSLRYDHSHVGGVSDRHQEQWDYYVCSTCGTFQYRQRTRKIRRVSEQG